MKFTEDYEDSFDPSLTNDFEDSFNDESFIEPELSEVEVVLDEPTRMVDVDGSVVLAEPGDIVTIKSESLKRIRQ